MSWFVVWLWKRVPKKGRVRGILVWLFSPKFVVGVSGLVRDAEGRVLLLKHTYRGDSPWGLPGGGLGTGESLEECLQREMLEESGLRVEVLAMLSGAVHYDRRLVDVIFSCRPMPGESLDHFRPNAEIAEARFFDPDALPDGLSPGQRRLVKVALAQARERDR